MGSLPSVSYSQHNHVNKKIDCDFSDQRLIYLKDVLCSSLGEPTVTVSKSVHEYTYVCKYVCMYVYNY